MKTLKCEMRHDCEKPVTHLDESGFIYCKEHGEHRKRYKRCRKLTPAEIKILNNEESIAKYEVKS